MLKVIAASFLICLSMMAQAIADYGEPSSNGPTGPVANGFVLSLQTKSPDFKLHSPIGIILELRNVSGRFQQVDFNSRSSGYDFSIRNVTTGQLVSRNSNSSWGLAAGSSPSGGWVLEAGKSVYGFFRLDLLYSFSTAGTYSVQVSSGHPILNGHLVTMQSNKVMITVR